MSDQEGAELSCGVDESSSQDKPNITIDGQNQAHIHMADDNTDGSIVAARNEDVPADSSKDPKISHASEAKPDKQQSKCCLLL